MEDEAIVSELDIFAPQVVQTSILGGDYVSYRPLQTLDNAGPIIFQVPGAGDNYLDISKTLLYAKIRIVDGKTGFAFALGTDSRDVEYSFVNNLLDSLFSEVKFELNQTCVSSSSNLNHFRSYLETLFSYNETAKKSHLTAGLFSMDQAGGFADLCSPTHIERMSYVKGGKSVELMGRLSLDVCNSGKLLLNEIDMRLTLTRNPDSVVCMVSKSDIAPKIVIDDAVLYVRKVNVSPTIMLAHAKMLQNVTAKYNYTRVEMNTWTIPAGVTHHTLENLFLGRVPTRIIFGLVKNSAVSGNYMENCFDFQNYSVSQLTLSINGKIVNSSPYSLNFAGNENYLVPFMFSFISTGNFLADDGYCVNRQDYKDGYCLYAYDLSPNESASFDYCSPPQQGNVRLELTFKIPLAHVVNVVCHAEYPETLEIDRNREVMIQYKK